MKKQFFLAIAIAATLTACKTTPKGDEATTTDTQTVATTSGADYLIDSASVVGFTGNGVGKNHPGTFKLTDGKISVADGKVTSGSFTINIAGIILTEPAEMIQTKLKGHLLSPDFFDAAKYPTAKFEITKITDYTSNETDKSVVAGANALVSGNLTLKDSTKNVSFPAVIIVTETEVTAKANFNIDRTQWGMSYGNDKSLKDKFISPEVNIAIDIKAKK